MKRIDFALLISLLLGSPLYGEFNRGTSYIDIPKADVLGANLFRLQTNGYFGLGKDSLSPADLDITLSYGLLDRAEIGFSMYETKSFAGFLAFQVLKEKGGNPSLNLGIQEISNQKWISSVGGGGEGEESSGFPDDLSYWNGGGRNPERFSAYVVLTRNSSSRSSFSFGLGRGRFVGYGFRSRFFNTDLFLPEEELKESANSDAVGLFFGGEARVAPVFFLLFDFDGRDLNSGIQYRRPDLSIGLALTHMEQILGGGESPVYGPLNSRLALGIEWNTSSLKERARRGLIAGRIIDQRSQKPVRATITLPNTEVHPVQSDANGRFNLKLREGDYLIQVTADGYETRTWRVSPKIGETTPLEVTLKEKELPEVTQAVNLGYEYFTKGDLLSAKREYQEALQLDPDHPLATEYLKNVETKIEEGLTSHRSKALKYTSAGDLSKAIQEWKAVLALDPSNGEAKTAVSILNMQLTSSNKPVEKPTTPPPKIKPETKPKTEPPKVTEPKKLTPQEIEDLYRKGVTLFQQENFKEAIKVFQEILKSEPNHENAKRYKEKAEVRLKAIEG